MELASLPLMTFLFPRGPHGSSPPRLVSNFGVSVGKPEYTPKEIERGRRDEKEKVAGKFTVDGKWYRAEVVKILTKGKDKPHYELRYIDFGNVCFNSPLPLPFGNTQRVRLGRT
jgi:hypothetical protein